MPPELRLLTSLQTLTNFVVGTGSDCSNIGELKNLNIGGSLLLSQLENLKAQDAEAGNFVSKKELKELSLSWTNSGQDEHHDHKVLEGLKSPDGLQALRIYSYQGTTFPTWMGMLQNMVKLYFYDCKNSEKFPPLCHLTALEVLCLDGLEKLQILCSGDTPFAFPKLKVLRLDDLNQFEKWCETDWGHEENIIFPRLERLTIYKCGMLTTLPKAPMLQESNGEGDGIARSAFPALKVLRLSSLGSFCGWEPVDIAQGRQIIFPQLEELSIEACLMLKSLPEAPFLKGSYGRDNTAARSAFPTLKVLKLVILEIFCGWEPVDIAQGRQIIFPQLEELSIMECRMLKSLPEAPFLKGSYGRDNTAARSAFPTLKVLELKELEIFCAWEPVDIAQGRQIIFPELEELSICFCPELIALPEVTLLGASLGHDDTTAQPIFPELKDLKLVYLKRFNSWGVAERAFHEQQTFPKLEIVYIRRCPELTTLPTAPKLSELKIEGSNPQIYPEILHRCINSLSKVYMSCEDSETTLLSERNTFELVGGSRESPLKEMKLSDCNFLFCSTALALWTCFVQLKELDISDCDALVNLPEKEFQSLVSLRSLHISNCNSLVQYTQAAEQQTSERRRVLPQLECLRINKCAILVKVEVPASLKILEIRECPQLEHIVFGDHQDKPPLNQGTSTEVMKPTDVRELSSSARDPFLPCLECLKLGKCERLAEVHNLPPSLMEVDIDICGNLRVLSGQLDALKDLEIDLCPELRSLESCLGELPSLERLYLMECERLASLPKGPQWHSSLRYLLIMECPGIKSLPSSLQRRLPNIKETSLDARYEGAKLLKPKTWKYAIPEPPSCRMFRA